MTCTSQQELLRQYLDQHEAICPRCKYNLHKLTGDTCPECGEKVRLQVGLVHPKLGWYLTGLIGLAAGAGFSGFLILYCFIRIILNGPQIDMMDKLFVIIFGGFIVEGSVLFLWVLLSRRIRSSSTTVQIMLALGCWILSVANAVIFSLLIL